ncbi:MAG TPA: TIGR04283 family arsenosugar biosynthesis glycosyltransferase, partial [Gammaproteobacteria bacterium]
MTIVIPARNEEATLPLLLLALQAWRGADCELLVVDGGSGDATVAVAAPLADRVLVTEPGRALQMNAGAAAARGDALWFLHADTRLPAAAVPRVRAALARRSWGRFDVRLSGRHPLLRLVERLMNLRSRLSGIATGDQGLFVRREVFAAVGGFPPLPLMEDVALSRALKRSGPPACLAGPLVTSSRHWERDGILRTVLLMWRLRFA